jgi:hypothetical protein
MADTTETPAGTSYDDHHDGNSTLSRTEHLQAAGEHLAAANKLKGQHDGHMDAAGAHVQAVHDEDDRGGEKRSFDGGASQRTLDSVRSNPATARTFAAMRGTRR